MKRIFFLLCALLLLADLADDGCLGKAKSAVPRCPGTISFTSSLNGSVKVESQVGITPTRMIGIRQRWQNQAVLVEVNNAPPLIHPYLFSSSGAIPL
jgi:hypothetical protein